MTEPSPPQNLRNLGSSFPPRNSSASNPREERREAGLCLCLLPNFLPPKSKPPLVSPNYGQREPEIRQRLLHQLDKQRCKSDAPNAAPAQEAKGRGKWEQSLGWGADEERKRAKQQPARFSRQTKGVDAGNREMSSGEARNRGHDGWNLDQMRAFGVQNGSSCFAHQTPRLRSPDQCPTQLTLLLRDIKKRPSPQASALQGVNEANPPEAKEHGERHGRDQSRAKPPRAMQEPGQAALVGLARPRI
jgi:hypothetical protein